MPMSDSTGLILDQYIGLAELELLAAMRRDRVAHPVGKFDRGGRWYPSDRERASCCAAIRSPSRAHPYSYMVHCRTRKHLETWYLEHVCAPLVADLFALFTEEK